MWKEHNKQRAKLLHNKAKTVGKQDISAEELSTEQFSKWCECNRKVSSDGFVADSCIDGMGQTSSMDIASFSSLLEWSSILLEAKRTEEKELKINRPEQSVFSISVAKPM